MAVPGPCREVYVRGEDVAAGAWLCCKGVVSCWLGRSLQWQLSTAWFSGRQISSCQSWRQLSQEQPWSEGGSCCVAAACPWLHLLGPQPQKYGRHRGSGLLLGRGAGLSSISHLCLHISLFTANGSPDHLSRRWDVTGIGDGTKLSEMFISGIFCSRPPSASCSISALTGEAATS